MAGKEIICLQTCNDLKVTCTVNTFVVSHYTSEANTKEGFHHTYELHVCFKPSMWLEVQKGFPSPASTVLMES